jgi:hypothetical protein
MKKWYESKTLWINVISIMALLAQSYYKKDVISPEIQATLLSIINLVLRLITKDGINWTGGDENSDNNT